MNAGQGAMFRWLDAFESSVRFEALLETKTGLRVGRGRDWAFSESDLPLLRGARGLPYIPGSSLKGVLRSSAEALLRGMAVGEGADEGDLSAVVCDIFGAPCTKRDPKEKGSKDDELSAKARVEKKREFIRQRSCLICATFGGTEMASHLKFRDAHPVESAQLVTSNRDGVAIDRDLGRVAGSLKYEYEIVEPWARFKVTIDGQNLLDWQVGLLLAATQLLDDGLRRVGGFGSRGLGQVGWIEQKVVRRTLDDVLNRKAGTALGSDDLEKCVSALRGQVQTQLRERATKDATHRS